MDLTIISPEGTHLYQDIIEVTLPTDSGMITIRPGHVHLTTSLQPGDVTWTDKSVVDDLASFADQTKHLHIPGGIALFADDTLRIMTSEV